MSEPTPFDDGELYDALLGGLPYGIDFYVALARRAGGPVLDVACGTGRVLLPCLQAGADGDGLDLSRPMLETARRKADALGLRTELHEGDMSDFRLPRRYALVMITFNAFVHNLTQEAQIRTLERCREHLLPGGRLALDTFFPGLPIVGAEQGTRVFEGETRDPRDGALLRAYDTRSFDRVAQTQRSLFEVERVHEGAAEVIQRADFLTRYVYREEMALLLRAAGFSGWRIDGDFEGRPLTRETDSMVVTAER